MYHIILHARSLLSNWTTAVDAEECGCVAGTGLAYDAGGKNAE